MQEIWKSWTEVKKICSDKKVIFWGRSEDWVPKTVPKFEFVRDKYIVDSNPAYNGTSFCGLTVHLPEILKGEDRDNIYIIITGGVYESIADSLNDLGFEPGTNYCCTPAIRDWGLLQEIREYKQNIIVVCSDYSVRGKKRYSKLGGGIYICNTRDNTLEKKISGHLRQIAKVDDHYYAVEFVEKKVFVLSKEYKKIDELPLDQTKNKSEKPNACGIAYYPKKGLIFVANAGSDTINIYEKENFKCIETIHFSEKFKKFGDGQHHINDIEIVNDALLVSHFSVSGNWKREVLDGGVVEYDINDFNKGFQILVQDLWMPHSIKYIDGSICYLDSMRGEFWIGDKKVEGRFPGFLRGLAYDGRFYYIGQSEDMYMSRLFGVKDNIMCNAGVYLFDVSNKVSRFYSFPFLMNVHDLMIE
jgi:hypothetical protein